MSYADLLQQELVTGRYIVVMKPRRQCVDSWTLVSGTIYKQTFDYGYVSGVDYYESSYDFGYAQTASDSIALTAHTSASVTSGQFYYDITTQELYINVGANPTSSTPPIYLIATYEIYLATEDVNWHRDPLDSESDIVYFEPLISDSPTVVSSSSDTISGFLPSYSSSVSILNATKYMQRHIYDSSFNKAPVSVYHLLGDTPSVTNTKLILSGYTTEISSNDKTVTLQMLDASSLFDKEFRHSSGPSFFAQSDFPLLDPRYVSRAIRKVYGLLDEFIPVNVDYDDSSTPDDTKNRKWVVGKDYDDLGTVSTTVAASPSSGVAFQTYLTSVDGLNIGDWIWFPANSDGGTITAIAGNLVSHTFVSGGVPSAGATVVRAAVPFITIYKPNYKYKLVYGANFDIWTDSVLNLWGFELDDGAEPDSIDDAVITPFDTITCRVYGNKNTCELSGSPFGADSVITGNLSNAYIILYDILRRAGIAESDIDTDVLDDLFTEYAVVDTIGFAIPKMSTSDFPTYKDIIVGICQTVLSKFFLSFNNQWTIAPTEPVFSADREITDQEITEASFEYDFNYSDILSRVEVRYRFSEGGGTPFAGDGVVLPLDGSYIEAVESDVAKNLHKVDRQKTFDSLHLLQSSANVLAERILAYFSDRLGTCKIKTKNNFFDSNLGESVSVQRKKLAGYEFDADEIRSRNFVITTTRKSLNKVDIELDDQKGVQDNDQFWES